jgi:hypothetical protein
MIACPPYANRNNSRPENELGLEILKPAAQGVRQRRPVSKRVNNSKAEKEDDTLIEPVEIEALQLV